ncbi:MAG: inorganic diphosphatase [Flavisolibacter sp.]|jgi:inorganic pyrophosphatase
MKKKPKTIDIIIETPKGCRNKYVYDRKAKAFRLKKILPAGAVFPFDFGFIPGTKGEDGDPLDVLIVMDEAAYPGCVVECKIIGALKATQSEGNAMLQNDRLVAVPVGSHMFKNLGSVKDLNENILSEIEHFFISYNRQEGKKFVPQGWTDSHDAMTLIEKAD